MLRAFCALSGRLSQLPSFTPPCTSLDFDFMFYLALWLVALLTADKYKTGAKK